MCSWCWFCLFNDDGAYIRRLQALWFLSTCPFAHGACSIGMLLSAVCSLCFRGSVIWGVALCVPGWSLSVSAILHTLSHSVSEHIQYFSPYVSFGCCIGRMWASLFEWFRSQCWSATALKRFLKTTIILKHSSFRKVNETLSLHVKIAARLMGCEMGYCCWPRPEKQQVAPLSLN